MNERDKRLATEALTYVLTCRALPQKYRAAIKYVLVLLEGEARIPRRSE